MSESVRHMKLVQSLVVWVSQAYFQGDLGRILVDSAKGLLAGRPPMLGGYVPDVYAKRFAPRSVVVGEAKTARDLENRHTRAQLVAFLKHCAEFPDSVLVLAVPWHMTRFAKALMRVLLRQQGLGGVKTVVLEQLEG